MKILLTAKSVTYYFFFHSVFFLPGIIAVRFVCLLSFLCKYHVFIVKLYLNYLIILPVCSNTSGIHFNLSSWKYFSWRLLTCSNLDSLFFRSAVMLYPQISLQHEDFFISLLIKLPVAWVPYLPLCFIVSFGGVLPPKGCMGGTIFEGLKVRRHLYSSQTFT